MKSTTKKTTSTTTAKKKAATEAARTTPTIEPNPSPTKADDREHDRENLRGLVDEAREHLNVLTTLFACVDTELEDAVLGTPRDRRTPFLRAIAGVVADLDCIVNDHCGEEVAS